MKLQFIPLALAISLLSNTSYAGPLKSTSTKKSTVRSGVANIYSGVNFHYLDQEDRIDIITSFLKRVKVEYALLPLKEKRLGLSLNKMREEALAIEKNVDSIVLVANEKNNLEARERVSFIQAKQNQEFFDRMAKLVAQFKDTHFGIRTKISRPSVYIGMNFYRADGKVLIGSLENKLMGLSSKLSGSDFSAIKAGDEVLAIDGVAVEDKVNELKPYINASSDGYADMMSIWALSSRDFKYPEKNFTTIKFKNAGTFKIPFFASTSLKDTPRLDANIYFNKIGIPADTSTIGLVFDNTTKTWNDAFTTFTGYSTRNLYMNLADMKEYVDDKGEPAIRTGYYLKKGVAHGVLQLLTFHTEKVKRGDVSLPFIEAIANFINELKANDADLIIDLRNNGGGSIRYTSQLLGLIAKTGAIYPGQTAGYRIVPSIREIREADLFQLMPGELLDSSISRDALKNLFQNTIDEQNEYTPMFAYGPVTPDPVVGGFDNKIVALITPNCISACDITSFILKASGRATLIGSQSNGTGAGFNSSDEVNNNWEDDLKVFNTSIPNLLFGIPGSTDAGVLVFEKDSVDRLDTENRPTVADVQYSNTTRDILNKNIGWLEKAVEVLESK